MTDYSYASEQTHSTTALTLLRTVGGFARPNGRGWFMFRSLTVASSTAAILGVACAITLGVLTGAGALGFVVGSMIGFCGGTLHYFHVARMEALGAIQKYPRLLQHHMEVNFPGGQWADFDAEARARDGTLLSWFGAEHLAKYSRLQGGKATIDAAEGRSTGISRSGVTGLGIMRWLTIQGRQGQLVSSYQTALDSLVDIETRREQRIVEMVVKDERKREAGVDDD